MRCESRFSRHQRPKSFSDWRNLRRVAIVLCSIDGVRAHIYACARADSFFSIGNGPSRVFLVSAAAGNARYGARKARDRRAATGVDFYPAKPSAAAGRCICVSSFRTSARGRIRKPPTRYRRHARQWYASSCRIRGRYGVAKTDVGSRTAAGGQVRSAPRRL